jgi:hypothetical protein
MHVLIGHTQCCSCPNPTTPSALIKAIVVDGLHGCKHNRPGNAQSFVYGTRIYT